VPRVQKYALVLATSVLIVAAPLAQEHPTAPHRHPDAQLLKNPAPSTPESLAAGAKTYARYCAVCHGTTGRGDGKLAAAMAAYNGAYAADLTDGVWQHGSSDGEIFVSIRDGIGPEFVMDSWRGKIPDQEIWNLVNYIKTLAPETKSEINSEDASIQVVGLCGRVRRIATVRNG
jgi:mono/diheme cytochrome c family protein